MLIDSNLIDTTTLETEMNLLRQEIQSAEESVIYCDLVDVKLTNYSHTKK